MCLECFAFYAMRVPDWPFCDMLYSFVDCHQFPVISTVFLLCWAKLLGEESEGLPGILHTLLQ